MYERVEDNTSQNELGKLNLKHILSQSNQNTAYNKIMHLMIRDSGQPLYFILRLFHLYCDESWLGKLISSFFLLTVKSVSAYYQAFISQIKNFNLN